MWKRGNCSRSRRSTRRPRRASAVAVLEPPGPPPMTTASKSQASVGLMRAGAGGYGVEARDRLLVLARAHAALGEDAPLGDPLDRPVEDLLRVGLEHQALAGAPAPGVHEGMEADRELVAVVVRVEIGPDVDVALRALQRPEEPLEVLGVRLAVDHRRDHERGVDDLPEAELLGEVVRAAEQGGRRRLALDEELHAAEEHAVVEGELELVGAEVRFERLDRGVVAPGLIADRDRDPRQLLGAPHRRVGRHEDPRRRHRVGVRVELAVAGGRGDPDGPVAGAAHVGRPARLERLVGAHLVAAVVDLAVRRLDQLAEDVVEALRREVALLLGDPFLQAEVRLDDELRHGHAPSRARRNGARRRGRCRRHSTAGAAPAALSGRARPRGTGSGARQPRPR